MHRSVHVILFLCLLLVFNGCRSEPSADRSANTNAPVPEKTPAAEEKAKEANYRQMALEIHRRVNEFRQSEGLEPLGLNPVISEQAREHSIEMAESPDTISHRKFDQRIEEIRKKIPLRASAENVAANLHYENPGVQVVEGWKQSPEHRKNMLGDYNQTGIGIARSEDGKYFFTQIYWRS
jgi:uncharacterized protein YkwD